MLENYIENFDPEKAIREVMEKKGLNKTAAKALMRKEIPEEGYFQKKIKEAVKKRYPSCYIVKIAQGAYSEGGIPDIMVILEGHYFGFEVKRPVFGEPSELQKQAIKKINAAGGTAAVVIWPEEAIKIIEEWRD